MKNKLFLAILLLTTFVLANVHTNKLTGVCPIHAHEVEQKLSEWSGVDKSNIREILENVHRTKLWNLCKNNNPETLKLIVKFGGIEMVNFFGEYSEMVISQYPNVEKKYFNQLKNPETAKIYDKISGFVRANYKNLDKKIKIVNCLNVMPEKLQKITSDYICFLPYFINMNSNQMIEVVSLTKDFTDNDKLKLLELLVYFNPQNTDSTLKFLKLYYKYRRGVDRILLSKDNPGISDVITYLIVRDKTGKDLSLDEIRYLAGRLDKLKTKEDWEALGEMFKYINKLEDYERKTILQNLFAKTSGFSGLNVFKIAKENNKCNEWKKLTLNAPAAITCYDEYYSGVNNAFDILIFEIDGTNEAALCGARLLLEEASLKKQNPTRFNKFKETIRYCHNKKKTGEDYSVVELSIYLSGFNNKERLEKFDLILSKDKPLGGANDPFSKWAGRTPVCGKIVKVSYQFAKGHPISNKDLAFAGLQAIRITVAIMSAGGSEASGAGTVANTAAESAAASDGTEILASFVGDQVIDNLQNFLGEQAVEFIGDVAREYSKDAICKLINNVQEGSEYAEYGLNIAGYFKPEERRDVILDIQQTKKELNIFDSDWEKQYGFQLIKSDDIQSYFDNRTGREISLKHPLSRKLIQIDLTKSDGGYLFQYLMLVALD